MKRTYTSNDSSASKTSCHDNQQPRKRQRQNNSIINNTAPVIVAMTKTGRKSVAQPRPTIHVPPRGIGPVVTPNENDVLCGRGGRVNSHTGNIQLRQMVQERKQEYLSPSTKKLEKAYIAAKIVQDIRSMQPPGRFLKEDNDSNDGTSYWYDIGDAKAIKKVGQALREDAPDIRPSESNTTTNNNASNDDGSATNTKINDDDKQETASSRTNNQQDQFNNNENQKGVASKNRQPNLQQETNDNNIATHGRNLINDSATIATVPQTSSMPPMMPLQLQNNAKLYLPASDENLLHVAATMRLAAAEQNYRYSLLTKLYPTSQLIYPPHSSSLGGNSATFWNPML